ncbi:MAG: formyltransferase family protein [bacterium]|nr:formyltransferase family protein [bacterium]
MSKERLGSLISGGGTTMREIVLACRSGLIPLDPACVISSDPKASGIEKAKKLGVRTAVVDPNNFRTQSGVVDQESFGLEIKKILLKHGVSVVTQNGWMPLTPEVVIDEYKSLMFNQHPGPVPEFGGKGMYGRRVHAARLLFVRNTQNRDPWTLAIAQKVDKDFDKGKVVEEQRVDISPNDTVDDLQQRVLSAEYAVQIRLLQNFCSGNLRDLPERKLVLKGEEHILFEARRNARFLYPHG